MAKAPAPKAPKKEAPPPPADDDGAKAGDEKAKEDDKKGAGGKKPIVMIAVAAVGALVLGIGGGVAIMKVAGGSPPAPPAAAPAEAHAEAPAEVHAEAPKAPERASGGGEPAESGGHGGGGGGGGHGGGGEEAAPIVPVGPVNVAFKPFIVNLNDLGGRRMLKLTLSVDVENQDIADEVNAKMPQFTDTILLLLSSIQSDDVSGLDGKQRLKNQMINRINQGLTKGKLRNLYFSELVVQ
jgi:flagellar FliL protein